MSRKGFYKEVLDHNGDKVNRWVQESASERCYPVPAFKIGGSVTNNPRTAATRLARWLASRVGRVLNNVGSKPLAHDWSGSRAREQRLYARAFPRAKKYVAKYLR